MGGGAADHGQASAEPAIPEHRREPRAPLLPPPHGLQETAPRPIPDELVAEIFLRLPAPADLVRASLACVSFRSLIADRSFLRRFRKLHAPPLLGFLDERRNFFPVIPPSPFASAANAVGLAADFSFSFLPAPAHEWKVRDARGGRVLLKRSRYHDRALAVCDPLYRRYLLLPQIPGVEVEGWVPRSVNKWHSFLKEEEEAAEETSFTVVSIARRRDKHAAFIFSSSTGQYVNIAIVEAGEDIIGMFVFPYHTSDLIYLIRRNNGGSSSQWRLEKTIRLDSCWYSFRSSIGRHLLLFHSGSSSQVEPGGTFMLDIKTLQLEKVSATSKHPMPYVYSNFPPSLLSSPTISSAAS